MKNMIKTISFISLILYFNTVIASEANMNTCPKSPHQGPTICKIFVAAMFLDDKAESNAVAELGDVLDNKLGIGVSAINESSSAMSSSNETSVSKEVLSSEVTQRFKKENRKKAKVENKSNVIVTKKNPVNNKK